MADKTKGNCYLCGAALNKTAIKNHILKTHGVFEGGQQCYLLKIEGAYNDNYWLYVDVPLTASLSNIDAFLRKIWLECCGHLSVFHEADRSEIENTRKLSTLAVGDQLEHEYDFGDTTESVISIVGETARKPQKNAVRLLARNIPPVFQCSVCGEPAEAICTECSYETDNPFFCASCADEHEHEDMLLPVTNSPRMGVCAYDGELDVFAFKPVKSAG